MLRILLDEGISRAVARDLQTSGYAVEHALDLSLKGQPDPIIFQAAQQRLAVICTLNRADYLLLATAWTAWGFRNSRRVDRSSSRPPAQARRNHPITPRAV